MKFVDFGERKVSAIGLGLGNWGSDFDQKTADQIVQRALDLGINLFDTAELYGSEATLGSALGTRRKEAFVATKVNNWNLKREPLVAAAAGSRTRLAVENIDLYQIHWPNFRVPLSVTMAGMRELLDKGVIDAVGVCNFSLRHWQKAEAALGRPIVSNQVPLSLVDSRATAAMIPHCQRERRVIIAYRPLAQGLLTGRYAGGNLPKDVRATMEPFAPGVMRRAVPLLKELQLVAAKHDATPAQIALAWVLRFPQVVTIPGASSVAQLEANARAAEIDLTADEWEKLATLGRRVRLIYPRREVKAVVARLMGF
jgi:aryl-alcohol dehydrogenase-like predicted oxidoreductase